MKSGANNSATASGVPGAGVIGSVADAQHAFALQPNGAGQNNALMLDVSITSGSLDDDDPGRVLGPLVPGGRRTGRATST